jgi:hypothetical protein
MIGGLDDEDGDVDMSVVESQDAGGKDAGCGGMEAEDGNIEVDDDVDKSASDISEGNNGEEGEGAGEVDAVDMDQEVREGSAEGDGEAGSEEIGFGNAGSDIEDGASESGEWFDKDCKANISDGDIEEKEGEVSDGDFREMLAGGATDLTYLSDADGNPPSSPIELQGASRTTGGIFRGKAVGNSYKMADFGKVYSFLFLKLYLNYTEDEQDNFGPSMAGGRGLVYLYTARDSKAMSMKQNVAPLNDVLGNLATLYSPIKSDVH